MKSESNSAHCLGCNRLMPRKTSKRKTCSVRCSDEAKRIRTKLRRKYEKAAR